MAQRYDMIRSSQLGERYDSLLLEEDAGRVTGTISLPGFNNPASGKQSGQRLELVHKLRTTGSTLQCRTELTLCGGRLHGAVSFGYGVMELRGEKAAGAAWGRKENGSFGAEA